jgi:2-polyprenyl-3-methyl-5-hydroxy-6-metoxy-1,4-benzoquinol methylase
MMAGIGGVLPRVAEAYRTGAGVPYEAYGGEFRHGQGHINRPAFTGDLPGEWLEAMPDVAARLRARPGARVADIGCGQGWSAIAVARAYPLVRVEGIDADPRSVMDARAHAAAAGLDGRVRFVEGDAAALGGGPYELVLVLETLHDLPRPVEALRAARAATVAGGAVLVADERVADAFAAPGDEVERMMYGWSVTHCLPTQMVETPSAALGTVMRSSTVRELAAEAGFAAIDVLPVENDFFRLYRLHP